MTETKPPSINTLRQRKFRAKMESDGCKRLDIYIPKDLWVVIKPQLNRYGGPTHPGKALVNLLADIDFGEE